MYTVKGNTPRIYVFEQDDTITSILEYLTDGHRVVPPFQIDDIYYTTKVLNNIMKHNGDVTGGILPALGFILKQDGAELLEIYDGMGYNQMFIPYYVGENAFDKIQAWHWQGELTDHKLYFEKSTIGGTVWDKYPTWHPVVRVTR